MLIRYYGPVGIPSGYGYAANETCMAILSAGLDLEIQTYNPNPDGTINQLPARYAPLVPCIRSDGDPPTPDPDIVIVHTLPRDCARVLAVAQIRDLYPRAKCVAYTTWETAAPIPEPLAQGLRAFDQVWVPSRETWRTVATDGPDANSVYMVPHAFDESLDTAQEAPAAGPRPYRFYYVGAWTRRKNPEGVIQAYLRAFRLGDDVELVVQAAGARHEACLLAMVAATGMPPSYLPKVVFDSERIADAALRALHARCDCFVTASRGEAWNLPAFDAMLARRHIISPEDLGSTDYLRDTSAWLYRSRLVPAGGEAFLLPPPPAPQTLDASLTAPYQPSVKAVGTDITVNDDWWEPDIADLSLRMRRAYAERVTGLAVHYDPATRYGRRAVGALIRRLLETKTTK